MNDEPSSPSNPSGNPPNGGQNRSGGRRSNWRRFPSNRGRPGQPPTAPNDIQGKPDRSDPSEPPLPIPSQTEQAQNPPAQAPADLRRERGARTGKKPRNLPERDRGPRRGDAGSSQASNKPAAPPTSQGNEPSSTSGQSSPQGSSSRGRPNQHRRQGQRGQAGRQSQGGQPRSHGQGGPQGQRGSQNERKRQGAKDPTTPVDRTSGHPNQPKRQIRPANSTRQTGGAISGDGIRKPRKPGQRPFGERSNNGNFDYVKPPPIKTNLGIKARSQEGQYVLSWWAARWIGAMENLVDGRRLGRGKSYAKDGQVLQVEEKPGGVTALVQGSRPKPYRVALEVLPLTDFEWDKVFDVLASQALFAAQLLAGEMPRNIEEAFEAAGTSLFPARLGDLHTDCTCPDWANPCKHVAATHYILAERFDEDPFLLFRLRGRSSEQILSELRRRRSGASDEPIPEDIPVEQSHPIAPLPTGLEQFYSLNKSLDDFSLSFKEPAVEMAVLKRLGDPNFLGQESLLATLEPVYRAIRAAALEAALGEAGGEEEENGKTA